MKRQRTGTPLVVIPLGKDADDHPRPIWQAQGEQRDVLSDASRPFAEPLPATLNA